jgi:hypothetical protein
MVSMLASTAVDRGFETWLGQTKDLRFVEKLLVQIICYWLKMIFMRSSTEIHHLVLIPQGLKIIFLKWKVLYLSILNT